MAITPKSAMDINPIINVILLFFICYKNNKGLCRFLHLTQFNSGYHGFLIRIALILSIFRWLKDLLMKTIAPLFVLIFGFLINSQAQNKENIIPKQKGLPDWVDSVKIKRPDFKIMADGRSEEHT